MWNTLSKRSEKKGPNVLNVWLNFQMRYLPRFSRGSNRRFLFPYKQSSNQEEHFFNALSMFLKLIFLGPPRKTGHAWKHHRYDAIDVTYVDVCWLLPRTGNGMSNLLKLFFDYERDGKKIEWSFNISTNGRSGPVGHFDTARLSILRF